MNEAAYRNPDRIPFLCPRHAFSYLQNSSEMPANILQLFMLKCEQIEKVKRQERKRRSGKEEKMALGLLMIMFVAMSVISITGLLLLFLVKSMSVKKGLYYFLTVWGLFIAYLGATSFPTNYVVEQMISWAFGFLSVAGVLLFIKAKERAQYLVAYALVAVSVIGGLMRLFL